MSILDIIIFSVAGIIIAIYAYFNIKNTIKWRNLVKSYVQKGLTLEQAKDMADKEVYKRKYAKKQAKNKDKKEDSIYEE